MNLQEYKIYALAKKQIEYHSYDPRAKYQCVDLTNDYIAKVWGLTPIIGTNAKDVPEKLSPGMEFVKNTVYYSPEPGEIAVWNGRVGAGAGHISVVLNKGLLATFQSLDQNWSKPLFITLETHTYANIRGFIRKLQSNSEKTYGEDQMSAMRTERDSNWNLYKDEEKKSNGLLDQTRKLADQIAELEGKITGATTRATTAEKRYQGLIDTMAQKLGSIADEGRILERIEIDVQELDSATKKAVQLEKKYSQLELEKKDEIEALRRELTQLRADNEVQSKRITTLEDRIDSVANNTPTQNAIQTLLTDIFNFFRKEKWNK